MTTIQNFNTLPFIDALKAFFNELNVPINYIDDKPIPTKTLLADTYKEKQPFTLINDIYFLGIVDDAAFSKTNSILPKNIIKDYDGILIFGVDLQQRENDLLPTRSQLAEIARAINRQFYYTPVAIVFKYHNNTDNYISFAHTERLTYKQEWREGEKAGKVSILRDINILQTHSGHLRILNNLDLTQGKNIDDFVSLYAYWQEVFSTNLLNKKFYEELSHWYFWAIKQVRFPGEPTLQTAQQTGKDIDSLLQEHRATNVIRLLTRLLFTWFIKEKKLIPEALFNLDALQKDLLKDINPYHDETGLFKGTNNESIYYKAILQNLFFATLNCPVEGDSHDKRKRGFRGTGYGTHRGIDWLMRYEDYFKNPKDFLKLMNDTVPFLNGGLFECLDEKDTNTYVDGFSDQMTKGETLLVPDYLFFGLEEKIDLSYELGVKNAKTKNAVVKGIVNILKSYKFTITENTPIEEDVALDPELLGKVFENLLASYNPETKTTARKQTGSFYTPREIVNYMVDESLIAYLKNKILTEPKAFAEFGKEQLNLFGNEGKAAQLTLQTVASGSEFDAANETELDKKLHELVSYDNSNPFASYPNTTEQILRYLNECKILDPASGSGAFPMGILQKMVHILTKLDPSNTVWKQVQIKKVEAQIKEVLGKVDKNERAERLIAINEAFEESLNDADYARKLFLIENCIYGVDIQPIATQISKLRFFISLVVEQKVIKTKANFGIRPLPNLETKFVTANSLIGLERNENNLFSLPEVENLKTAIRTIRGKLFSARTKETKLKYRTEDERLRKEIAALLIKHDFPLAEAEKLSAWDPYNQNAAATYFDPEWMFDIKNGFDVVIGNPPYVDSETMTRQDSQNRDILKSKFSTASGNWDLFVVFIEASIRFLSKAGKLALIVPNKIISAKYTTELRKLINSISVLELVDYSNVKVFEEAAVYPVILILSNGENSSLPVKTKVMKDLFNTEVFNRIDPSLFKSDIFWDKYFFKTDVLNLVIKINSTKRLESKNNFVGAATVSDAYKIKEIICEFEESSNHYKFINTGTIDPYISLWGVKPTQYIKARYLKPVIPQNELLKLSENRFKQASCPKIIFAGMSLKVEAFLDQNGEYCAGKSTAILIAEINELRALIALFNSKLVSFWFSKYFNSLTMAGGYFNIGNNELSLIPISANLISRKTTFITLVDQILEGKKQGIDTAALEHEIDVRVYHLYELTYEEACIIDPQLSKADWERYKN